MAAGSRGGLTACRHSAAASTPSLALVHLHVHSCYSFLDGASDLESLVRRAAELGMPALALTDHNSLAAAVQFDCTLPQYGVRPIFGSELTMQDGSHLTLLARSQEGYANLCRLITLAFEHGGRLSPRLKWSDLAEHTRGPHRLERLPQVACVQSIRAGDFGRARACWTSSPGGSGGKTSTPN